MSTSQWRFGCERKLARLTAEVAHFGTGAATKIELEPSHFRSREHKFFTSPDLQSRSGLNFHGSLLKESLSFSRSKS